jgi:hypothetical protein
MPELDGGFIDAINKVPNPLKNPEDESTLAWDIMWSDPVRYIYNQSNFNGDTYNQMISVADLEACCI